MAAARKVGDEEDNLGENLAIRQQESASMRKQEQYGAWNQEEEGTPVWSKTVSEDLDDLLLDIIGLGSGPSFVHQLAELGVSESAESQYTLTMLQDAFKGLQSCLDEACQSLKAELQKPGQPEASKQSELSSRLEEVLLIHGKLLTSAGEDFHGCPTCFRANQGVGPLGAHKLAHTA